MSVFPNLIYRFNAIPIKIPASYAVNINNVHLERHETQKSKHNTEGEEQSWRADTTRLQDILESYSNQDSVVLRKE